MKIQIKIKTNGEAYYYAVQFNKYMINYIVSSNEIFLHFFQVKTKLPNNINRRKLIKVTNEISNSLQHLINIVDDS